MEFVIEKVPDRSLPGLGSNLHKITKHGETYAHMAVCDREVVVYINKTIKVSEIEAFGEFIVSCRIMVKGA